MRKTGQRCVTIAIRLGMVVALLALAGCAAPGTVRRRVHGYSIRVEGVTDKGVARDLLAMSDVAQASPDVIPDVGRLAVLARRDVPDLERLLHAHGYLGARVHVETFRHSHRSSGVTFRVDTGPVYSLARIVPPLAEDGPSAPGLAEGASAAPVALARSARLLQDAWRDRGHPYARVEIDHLVVDASTQTVDVYMEVERGPRAVFGPVSFEGRERLRRGWLRDAVPWREGREWQRFLLEQYRSSLLASGIFTTVEYRYPSEPDADGKLPVTVALRERRPRTLSLAAGYRTDEGIGGMLEWTHRNVTGGAEQLALRVEWAEKNQSASLDFRRPRFLRSDQALRVEAEARSEQTDAFDADGHRTAVFLEREWSRGLSAEVGLAGRDVQLEQTGRRDRFSLVSIPLGFNWDGRDLPHDPSRGGRVSVRLTPYHDLAGSRIWFAKNEVEATRYVRLTPYPDLRLAGRVRVGAISGIGPLRVPADERFYAGGGGSVRGYAYQSLAPRDEHGLLGGRSLVESSLELRWRITEHLGLVCFLDGGAVMRSSWPDGSERMRWGGGIGGRYYTTVGPIRMDVGIPLNRRAGLDDAWQLYISIGQAF